MGIESDQLVYDYLSRVGDLAQQAQLPSGDRMRLVTSLRGEIEKQRSRTGGGSPAGVRRILGRLGTPAEVVASAAEDTRGGADRGTATATPVGWSTGTGAGVAPGDRDAGGTGPAPGVPLPDPGAPGPDRSGPGPEAGARRPDPATPAPADGPSPAGDPAPPARPRGRLRIPRPRPRDKQAPAQDAPAAPAGASPPHLAGMDELGPAAARPDWWRIETGPFGAGERVGGFVGGIEVPEILRPPPEEDDPAPGTGDEDADAEDETGTDAAPARRGLRARLPRVLRRADPPEAVVAEPVVAAPPARVRLANPLLLLAAALLLTGAALGSLLPLAGGWLIAYGSRRLTAGQSKTAVLYLPGAAVAGGLVWLWGRVNGRWGEPIPQDGMREVLTGTWPWVLKGAAVATALYLLWRARPATRVR
ncbi:hypothetical protein [Streptomyces sp. NPDC005805]|uniref:hypothetical protein n=1 Tax=Streptomyces sp. NPDC005805 TaxID=3157068 RepID=UPI0033FFB5A5